MSVRDSPFLSPNTTRRDREWDRVNYDSGIVAVPKAWAAEKGLPMGSTFPWDASKTLYLLNSYHQLHCLVSGQCPILIVEIIVNTVRKTSIAPS